MSPSLALLFAIVAVLFLLRLKLHPGVAVFCGSLLLSLLALPPLETPRLLLRAATDIQTGRLLAIVVCALVMSRLMEKRGMLTRLANALEGIGPRLAIHLAPVAIGLLPLPGGAVVSAAAVTDLVKRLRLSPAQATFINFWFRHLCEFGTPVYPGVIMAGVILSVPLSFMLLHLAPMWILMLLFGSVVSWRILRRSPASEGNNRDGASIPGELLRSAWPVILVFALVIGGLDAAPAFLATVVAIVLQQRMPRAVLKDALRYGFDPKILFLLYAVMLFKGVVDSSGAADVLFEDLQSAGLPHALILIVLPALIGFSTGLSSAMVGISIPLLVPFLVTGAAVDGPSLMLAYGAGGLGYLLSPLHLCLVLSAEYFQARLASVYRLLVPTAVAVLAGLALLFILQGGA